MLKRVVGPTAMSSEVDADMVEMVMYTTKHPPTNNATAFSPHPLGVGREPEA
jgi:hypothetical protein